MRLIFDKDCTSVMLVLVNPAPDCEADLRAALQQCLGGNTPPRLRAATSLAVLGGGARLRPRLVLAVAEACGDADPQAARAAAVAIELVHCASLVHDDLPCFDDAPMRRGRPSVQAAFGPALAVLVGDGLIVAAFERLAHGCAHAPQLLGPLVRTLARAVGSDGGLVAGQAWESEPHVPLRAYHRAKTAALFEAAACAGALASRSSGPAWRELGRRLGEAYQLADDLADVMGDECRLGKPVGRDYALGRRSAVAEYGVEGARSRLRHAMDAARAAVPVGCDRAPVDRLLDIATTRLLVSPQDESAAPSEPTASAWTTAP
jgi:geranylgeranyl diphosphate synthase, type II